MSIVSATQTSNNVNEESRQQGNRCQEEVARLSEMDLAPAEYFGEFLKRVLPALSATAGAVWGRHPQGQLLLLYQINLAHVGLEETPDGRKSHEELLRQAFQQGRAMHLPAHSSPGPGEDDRPAPGNPTDFGVLLAPVVVDREVAAVVEIWYAEPQPVHMVPVFGQFLVRMAGLASIFMRNAQRRDMLGRQQLWTRLESFARHVHSSLNPLEVANIVANEGRRLVACDRISVALRQGRRPKIVAISGADVIEKRSNLVKLMRVLVARVLKWGDKLVYQGTRDESLPPAVFKALNAYLVQSDSKLLVVLPLRDEREGTGRKPSRSALVMESFEPVDTTENLVSQLEVVGGHAASALYNAAEYRRIPLGWLWRPLGRLQEGLGGKAKVLIFLGLLVIAGLIAALIHFPYPLKMDAQGQLLPRERCWVYSPVEGQVVRLAEGVQPGTLVTENQSLLLMDDTQLELKLIQLDGEIAGAGQEITALGRKQDAATTEGERLLAAAEKKEKEFLRTRKIQERGALIKRTNAEETRPGNFWLKAPINGTVLNWGVQESLINRPVKPSDPLLRIGDKEGEWEVELRIPERHIGQVLQAFDSADPNAELDVDLLLSSSPTRTFRGKLARARIAGEARPDHDDPGQSEPVVLASVRLDGPGIEEDDQVPHDLLLTGTEVHSKIRCGDRPMGYSLFYGVWEFFCEKVLFPFTNNP